MTNSYLKIAWRNIVWNKTYTLLNIIGLTLGLCSCLVIFLITRHELSFDSFHPHKQQIYRLVDHIAHGNDIRTEVAVPPPLPLAARNNISGWEAIAAYHTLSDSTIITEPSWFSIFKYDWLAGDPSTALANPYSVVISSTDAKRRFGNTTPADILGKEFLYKDTLRLVVTGVIKDWQGSTDFPYTDFISLSTITASSLKNNIDMITWGNGNSPWTSRALIKLRKETQPAEVEAQLASLIKGRLHPEEGEKVSFSLQPISDIHFNNDIQDGRPKAHAATQYILIGVAIFILLLAVTNFINLSTALSIRRSKEVGIRKVLGSSRRRLTIQFLLETGMLTFFSLLLAILLVNPTLGLFHNLIPTNLHFPILSPDVLIFLILITLITTTLAGFYPAKRLSSWQPISCLKGGLQKGGEHSRLRQGLIVFQFTITLVFIISTLIVRRQINYMRNEELGFSTNAIITLDAGQGDTTQRPKFLAEQIRQLAGVSGVTRQSFSPITRFHTMVPLQQKGKTTMEYQTALQIADENFIPLYQIKLLAGTNIRPADKLKEVVVNETMAKKMGVKDPRDAVGLGLYLGDSRINIIGVVADFHEYDYHQAILPIVMADIPVAETSIAIKLATNGKHFNDLQNTLAAVKKIWHNVYPGRPFQYVFLDEDIARMYEKEEATAFLINTAMLVTLIISCLGLFGLTLFSANQRTKEIGIRKVLGATTAQIAFILSRNIVALVTIAILIAAPIAWYATHRWLQDFAYRAPINGWIFIAAGFSALLIAIATIAFQTIKLSLTNPADTLRTEG